MRAPLVAPSIADTGESVGTKTRVTRQIPIHPALDRMLDDWSSRRWSPMNACTPQPDHLVVPSRGGLENVRRNQRMWEQWQENDLKRLVLHLRVMHATRRTFIDLGLEAGVLEAVLSQLTRRPKRTTLNAYGRRTWRQLGEAELAIELGASAPAEEGECAA